MLYLKNKDIYNIVFDKLPNPTMIFKAKDEQDDPEAELEFEPITYPKIRGTMISVAKAGDRGKNQMIIDEKTMAVKARTTQLMKTQVNRDRLPAARVNLKEADDSNLSFMQPSSEGSSTNSS